MNNPEHRIVHDDERSQILLTPSYVALRVHEPHRIVSFAPYRGGFQYVQTAVIHEVRDADLPPDLDPLVLLSARMFEVDTEGVGMLTGRSVSSLEVAISTHAQGSARVLVTAGLLNALRVGDTPGPLQGWGTINLICHLDVPLSDVALLEALSIVTEARTSAVIDARIASRRSGTVATGTGTDCIAVLAPEREGKASYAGKHTALGHVIGDATQRAVSAAVACWKQENGR